MSLMHERDDAMSYRMTAAWGIALFAMCAVCASCARGPSRVYPPAIDAAAAGAEAIKLYDTNKDRKISGDELDKCPALKSAMNRLDTAQTGAITAEQITDRIKRWQETKLGRTGVTAMVLRGGVPLEGATVRLVPEAFLGQNMKVAQGVTNMHGAASLSIETKGADDPPGVPPGFYRVEITKDGVNIPAKYNAETILGVEIALDSPVVREGIRCDVRK